MYAGIEQIISMVILELNQLIQNLFILSIPSLIHLSVKDSSPPCHAPSGGPTINVYGDDHAGEVAGPGYAPYHTGCMGMLRKVTFADGAADARTDWEARTDASQEMAMLGQVPDDQAWELQPGPSEPGSQWELAPVTETFGADLQGAAHQAY